MFCYLSTKGFFDITWWWSGAVRQVLSVWLCMYRWIVACSIPVPHFQLCNQGVSDWVVSSMSDLHLHLIVFLLWDSASAVPSSPFFCQPHKQRPPLKPQACHGTFHGHRSFHGFLPPWQKVNATEKCSFCHCNPDISFYPSSVLQFMSDPGLPSIKDLLTVDKLSRETWLCLCTHPTTVLKTSLVLQCLSSADSLCLAEVLGQTLKLQIWQGSFV